MAKKSKLLSALDAHKNRDYELERQKKLQKAAEKKKRAKRVEAGEDEGEVGEQDVCGSIEMRFVSLRPLLMPTYRRLLPGKNQKKRTRTKKRVMAARN